MMASSAALRSSLVIKTPEVQEVQEVNEAKDRSSRVALEIVVLCLLALLYFLYLNLFVFFIDPDGSGLVEHGVKHFTFAEHDFAELFFLGHGDGLHLDHFQDGEKSHDHGVARGASLKEGDE